MWAGTAGRRRRRGLFLMQIQNANNSLRGALRAACVNGCVSVCRTHAMRGLLFDYILASSDLARSASASATASTSATASATAWAWHDFDFLCFALSDPSGGVRAFGLHTFIVVVVDPARAVVVVVVLSTPLLLLSVLLLLLLPLLYYWHRPVRAQFESRKFHYYYF